MKWILENTIEGSDIKYIYERENGLELCKLDTIELI